VVHYLHRKIGVSLGVYLSDIRRSVSEGNLGSLKSELFSDSCCCPVSKPVLRFHYRYNSAKYPVPSTLSYHFLFAGGRQPSCRLPGAPRLRENQATT